MTGFTGGYFPLAEGSPHEGMPEKHRGFFGNWLLGLILSGESGRDCPLNPDQPVGPFFAVLAATELKMKSGIGRPEIGACSHFPERTTGSPGFHFADMSKRIE